MNLPKRRPKTGDYPAGSTSSFVPALANFKVAAIHLGAASAAALRMRFDRGVYPKRFLVQLTPSRPGVDLHAILHWIRWGSRKGDEASDPGPRSLY